MPPILLYVDFVRIHGFARHFSQYGNMQLLGIFIYSDSASNKDSYNFHTMDFQIVPSVIQY